MFKIIGRKEEKEILEEAYNSDNPEFIALYGRRRVGKTFLVRNTFSKKTNSIFLYVTGIKDGTQEQQIAQFTDSIARAFGHPELSVKKDWRETFNLLTNTIELSQKKKIVLFFDEFPWMVTRKSQLLQMLDYFWNRHWSMDRRIKLIICGSASNWILKNIIHNIGGLYNRATRVIHLKPFDLHQTKEYLKHKKVKLANNDIVHLYMVIGGIPFYLDQIKAGLSAMQNIEYLAFKKDSFLLKEFSLLYATLFGQDSIHAELARIIAQHCYGIGQEELFDQVTVQESGGWLKSHLEVLEQTGFIQRFTSFGRKKKGIFYKMSDEYSLFYFKWIEPKKEMIERGEEKGHWTKVQNSPAWHSWAGCAFESICNKHVPLIRQAVNLTMAGASQWRFVPKKGSPEQGAQIDLLFDREDRSITLCEIKYTEKAFAIDKEYAQVLQKKCAVFAKQTKTRKTLYLAMISASGLKKTIYSEDLISGVVTLDDLFREYV